MTSTIRFEASRVFGKTVIIILISLVIASLYFTFLGVSEYKKFLQHKNDFIAAEKSKIRLYMNYEQYGAAGFRVMLEPSALGVFFNRSDFVRDLKAGIDTSEIVNVYNGRKGKDAFSDGGRFGDLAQTVTVFGSLLMMIMGFLTFPNRHTAAFFGRDYFRKAIFSRLLPLNVFFVLMVVLNNVFARVLGVTFTADENVVFLCFILLSLLLLNCFFTAGLVLKAFFKYKKRAVTFLLIAWFLAVFGMSEVTRVLRSIEINGLPSVEKLNVEILGTLLEAERTHREYIRDFLAQHPGDSHTGAMEPDLRKVMKDLFDLYMTTGFIINREKEEILMNRVKKSIDTFSFYSSFSPVEFFNMVSADASGKGYRDYVDFIYYVLDLRDEFLRFYGEKRYRTSEGKGSDGTPPESFINNLRNIYKTRARLPETLVNGTAALLGYLLILSAVLSLLERKKPVEGEAPEIPGKVKRSNMIFLLTGKDKQEHLFETLRRDDTNRLFLDAASHTVLSEEVTASGFINFACSRWNIKKDEVKKNLELLGVGETDTRKKVSFLPGETRKKVICAIVFAGGKDVIMNDFIRGVSQAFEKQFLTLVAGAAAAGRTIVYVSSEIYSPASSLLKQDIDLKNYQLFQVDPQTISLR